MTPLFNRAVFIATIAAIAGIVETTAAQARPDTSHMTCAAGRALVAKQGAVVLGTGPSLFDRYVISRAYCAYPQVVEPAFVPTSDDRQCFIGYTCREQIYGNR